MGAPLWAGDRLLDAVILLIGWLIASALSGVVANLLRSINFNGLAERSGFSGFVRRMGVRTVVLHPDLVEGTAWEDWRDWPLRGEQTGGVVLYRLGP